MVAIKLILLAVILGAKLTREENEFFYDEFTEASDEDDKDVFLIAGGIPTEEASNTKEDSIVSIRTGKVTLYFGDNHFCAGTLIGANLVLTAAHCICDQNGIITRPRRLLVVAGSSYRLKRKRRTVEFKVADIYIHSKYKRKVTNDLAVLRLSSEIPQGNEKIKIASIFNEQVKPGTNCSIYGWGQLFMFGPYADRLLVANVIVLPQSICKRFYPKESGDDLICATSYENGGAGTCRGDSGGPLFCPDSKQVYRLAGVVAMSYHCSGTKPSIFTNVSYHYDWIREVSSSHMIQTSVLLLCLSLLTNSMLKL